jgi:hypothetical protein
MKDKDPSAPVSGSPNCNGGQQGASPQGRSAPLAEVAVLEAELPRRYDAYKLSLCHEKLNSEKAWNDVMAVANTLHSWGGQTAARGGRPLEWLLANKGSPAYDNFLGRDLWRVLLHNGHGQIATGSTPEKALQAAIAKWPARRERKSSPSCRR